MALGEYIELDKYKNFRIKEKFPEFYMNFQ